MEYIRQSTQFLENQIAYPLSNPYIMAVLKITLALYGAQIAPKAPKYLEDLFKNTFVKIRLEVSGKVLHFEIENSKGWNHFSESICSLDAEAFVIKG